MGTGIKHKTLVPGTKLNTSAIWGEEHTVDAGTIVAADIADNAVTESKIEDLHKKRLRASNPPNYTVWKDGATYRAECNIPGGSDYSGANATTVIQTVENVVDDTGGVIYLKGIQLPSAVDLTNNVVVIEEYQGKITVYNQFRNEGIMEEYFATDGTPTPIYGFHGPAAHYYNGRTYIAYSGPSFNPYVTYFDHNKQVWGTTTQAGTNPLTDDPHGAPSLIVDDSGYIHVFYGAHGQLGGLYHSKSTNPEDISSWTTKSEIADADDPTYPELIKLSDGTIYIFYRKTVIAGSHLPQAYVKSTDGGESWSASSTIIDFGVGYGIYSGTTVLRGNNIHTCWVMLEAGSGLRRNLYHAYLNTTDGKMYSQDGTDLGTTISLAEANANCKVFDSGASPNEAMSPELDVDSAGTPYVIWSYYDGSVVNVESSKWTGAAWSAPSLISTKGYWSGGKALIVTGVNEITAWISIQPITWFYTLDEYETTDGGTTWVKTKQLFQTLIYNEVTALGPAICPQAIPDYQNDLKVVFAPTIGSTYESGGVWYCKGNSYSNVYAWGDNGFVYRRNYWG